MGEVGDGSMSSPQVEYLPATENDDGSMGVDLSNLENPDTVSASVDCVARYCRRENKELRVKVPKECFSSIHPLSEMGFDKIEPAESTKSYIVLREGKALEVASDATLMQRRTIASSSNPRTDLICSQTLGGATLAVQTASETAREQGPEFHQSSRDFPSGATFDMGIDNEAAGLQGFSAGPEIPLQAKKRPRTRDFSDKEKGLLLQFKLEYLQDPANEGKSHKWLEPVTKKMKKNGHVRKSKSLKGLWDTLKKSRDALRRAFPEGITAYWNLTMDEKKALKQADDGRKEGSQANFPLTFEPKWVEDMEKIEKLEPRSAAKKETRSDGQEGVSLASTITRPANFVGAGSLDAIQASVQHPGQASAQGSEANLQKPGASPSCIEDFAAHSRNLREKDYQKMSVVKEQQVAVLREDVQFRDSASKKLNESGGLHSLESLDDQAFQEFLLKLPGADADLAGCNELENQE